jgi:hypothetical protein
MKVKILGPHPSFGNHGFARCKQPPYLPRQVRFFHIIGVYSIRYSVTVGTGMD